MGGGRPHLEALVAGTHESSSIAQLDGSDIVYVARVAVPKIITLAVTIGTRFPALQTSLGKVLLAALAPAEAELGLAEPSGRALRPVAARPAEPAAELRAVRARGWSLTDEQLAPGILGGRAAAGWGRAGDRGHERDRARGRDPGRGGHRRVPARLLRTAGAISADWAACQAAPQITAAQATASQTTASRVTAPQAAALP